MDAPDLNDQKPVVIQIEGDQASTRPATPPPSDEWRKRCIEIGATLRGELNCTVRLDPTKIRFDVTCPAAHLVNLPSWPVIDPLRDDPPLDDLPFDDPFPIA